MSNALNSVRMRAVCRLVGVVLDADGCFMIDPLSAAKLERRNQARIVQSQPAVKAKKGAT